MSNNPCAKKRFTTPFRLHMMLLKMYEMSTAIIVCPMSDSDLEEVLAIETDSFPHPWSTTHFHDELASPYSFPLVALDQNGSIVGYICPMLLLDEGHILDVAVHRDFRGHGIGKLLVTRVLSDCREKGAAFVSLEVRPSNVEALTLYKSLGFTETGRRKRYYENGEDAILMEYIYIDREGRGDAV